MTRKACGDRVTTFVACLVLLLLLQSTPAIIGQATSEHVSCTYANSTCSNCQGVCVMNELFPLLPSACHPESEVSERGTALVCVGLPSGMSGRHPQGEWMTEDRGVECH